MNPERLILYAVTERSCLRGVTLAQAVEAALRGGVTLVQLREKELPLKDFIREAKEIRRITDAYGVPLLINDNVEVCLESEAAGVHVGQQDMEAGHVRRLLGKDKIIGVTAKTPAQARQAQEAGADYLGSGAVFGSQTKKDAKRMSLETLDGICEAVQIPVAAIGGIDEQTIHLLAGHRMSGAAVVSGLFGSSDIYESARRMKESMLEILKMK